MPQTYHDIEISRSGMSNSYDIVRSGSGECRIRTLILAFRPWNVYLDDKLAFGIWDCRKHNLILTIECGKCHIPLTFDTRMLGMSSTYHGVVNCNWEMPDSDEMLPFAI